MVAAKISIGLFLLRITVSHIHKRIVFAAMTLSTVAGTAWAIVAVAQCQPVDYFWNRAQNGSCLSAGIMMALAYIYSGAAVITDFTFAILPIFLISGLNMSSMTKIVLIPILGMACV